MSNERVIILLFTLTMEEPTETTVLPSKANARACKPEIFENGGCLVCLCEQPGPMPARILNEIVDYLTEASGGLVEFDWHAQGGMPMLLYLGPYEVAKLTYMGAAAYLQEHSNAYKESFNRESDRGPVIRPSRLGTLEGPAIYGPDMRSFGQFWSRSTSGVRERAQCV